MMRKLFIMICLLLLPLFSKAEADKYIFEHIHTPSHWINAIYQDNDGFVWIAARNGLYRYLGHSQETVIEGDYIYDVQQDLGGRLWVKKRSGYVIYDPTSGTVSDEAAASAFLGTDELLDVLHVDQRGNLWWNEDGRIYFRSNAQEVKNFVGDAEGDVYDIFCRNDVAYVLTIEGMLYRFYQMEDGTFSALSPMGPAVERPETNMDYRFHCVFVDSSQNIWLSQGAHGVWLYPAGSSHGVYLSDDGTKNSLQGGFICAIEEDSEGNVWLASDHGGISIVNKKGEVCARLRNVPGDDNTIASDGVYALMRDRDDNIWVSYTKKGMSVYRGDNKTWSLSHINVVHDSGVPDDVNVTCEDRNGNLWFGTDGNGLVRKDKLTGRETIFNNSNSALRSNVITDIHCDEEGRVWIGTFYGGLSCYENGRMRTYGYGANSLASLNVWSIDDDASGRIWIATLGEGVQRFDPVTEVFETYSTEGGFLVNDSVHELQYAADGNVYIASAYGLTVLNPHMRTARQVGEADGLINMTLTGLEVDSRGLVWLDEDGVLQIYNPDNGDVYTPVHPSLVSVRGIVEDKSHAVWVTTDSGLCRFEVTRDSADGYSFGITSFSFPQQRNLHFNQRSVSVTSGGEFLIGTFDGYMLFSPNKISSESQKDHRNLYFTDLFVDGTLVADHLEYETTVTLNHTNSVIYVDFACLDYFSVQEHEHYYKMEGLSEEWLSADRDSRRLTFTNLNAGKYTLWFTSDISDPTDAVRLNIRVLPPWWATWWAILIYLSVSVAIIISAVMVMRSRRRSKMKALERSMQQERRHYLDEMKMQFFTNVSHDFRTPLTLILTPIEEVMAKEPEKRNDPLISTIYRNAQRLLNLVNEVLDLRKMEMYGDNINLASHDLVTVVKDTVSSFYLMAQSQNISLGTESEYESIVFDFDGGKIVKVLANLLSNAFKFTPSGGYIQVDISKVDDDYVRVDVKDSGKGVADKDKRRIFDRFYQAKDSPVGSGIGLHVVREFVILHGGDIEVCDNVPSGSVFSFTLPIRKSSDRNVEETGFSTTASSEREADGNRPMVLVVDDNDDFRTFMCTALSDEYNVVSASDGMEALKSVKDNDVDVVVCDVMMPVMNGIEFCRQMKSDIDTSHIPVILLTAKTMLDDEFHGLESGADDYLTKPFNMSILRMRISKFIEWKKRAKRIFQKELEITTEQITLTSMDDRLLQQAINVINENISNPDFSVMELSAALCMHRTSLYKKLLYITGKTPVEFIRAIRLKRAAALLETDGVYVAEIAYMVGFNSPKVFASHFKEEFGCSPSEYRRKSQNDNNNQ